MKKKIFYIFICFIFLIFMGEDKISAKSNSKNDIIVNFGSGDILNLNYAKIKTFKISDDNSFYFNGIKHQFDENFTFVDGVISVGSNNEFTMENDTFKLDKVEKIVTSNKEYEAYGLSVSIDFNDTNTSTYKFKQELCYKYNEVQECNIDKDDVSDVNSDDSFNYYYDFLPFYNKELVFDYLSYKFSLYNDDVSINFDEIKFEKEQINYKDYFVVKGYKNITRYNEKNYIIVNSLNYDTVYASFYYTPGYISDVDRGYKINFYICPSADDTKCEKVYTIDNASTSYWNYFSVKFPKFVYDPETKLANYNYVKIKADYICSNNCDDPRSQTTITQTNSEIYYMNLFNPSFDGTLNYDKKIDYVYATNKIVTNKLLFSDDVGVEKVYYLLTKQEINDINLINIEINNGEEVSMGEGLEGLYYLYLRVLDSSGINSSNLKEPYIYLFDFSGPNLTKNNFDAYSSSGVYKNVHISVEYKDNYIIGNNKMYYKVIGESEYNDIDKEQILSANKLYTNGVNIEEHIDKDGLYRVCFVGVDTLNNYGDLVCSNKYYLDITSLSLSEVSVSDSNSNYKKNIDININISEVDNGVSFKCGVFLETITISDSSELKKDCFNKQNNNFSVDNDGRYKLWIYASDSVENFSLLSFDNIYLLDGKAPKVTYQINGDNNVYSNNVNLLIDLEDVSLIDENSLMYQFYSGNYNENEFSKFSLDEGISYPYNYYGKYKIAIKACDILNNCNINVYQDDFLIDTGKIEIQLIGEDTITILRWGKYDEYGARAIKGRNGKQVTELSYIINGNVDTKKQGIYYIEYTSGEGINKASVIRKVIVKDSIPHIIVLFSLILVGESIILLRLFIKKRKNDSI